MKVPGWFSLARGALAGAGVLVSLVVFSALGILLHAQLPAGRALTAELLTDFLSGYFQGKVQVEHISDLSLHGLTAERVTVYDTYGNRVLDLSRLRARASLREIARKLLSNEQKISLIIHHVRLEKAEALIVPDPETKTPTVERALTPVPTPAGEPSGRYVRVWLPVIEVGQIFGRGQVSSGAPTLETDLSAVHGSVLVTPKGTAVDVARFAMKLRGIGGADAQGVGSFHLRYPGAIWGFFDGYFGEVQTSAFIRWDDDRLELRLDVPRADSDQVQAIWSPYPLEETASLHAEAKGPLSNLDTHWVLRVDDSVVTAEGPLSLGKDFGIELHADMKDVDIRALWPSAPQSSIDGKAWVSVWPSPGQVNVEFNAALEPSEVGTQSVPAIDVNGTYDELGLVSRATLHEPGLPAKVSFERNPQGIIHLELDAKRFRLDHPRIRPYLSASGLAQAEVRANIEDDQINGSFDADVDELRVASISMDKAHVEGQLSGRVDKLEDLAVDAKLTGTGFRREGLSFEQVSASARGSISEPKVRAELTNPGGQRLLAQGVVAARQGGALKDLSLSVENQGASLAVSAGRVDTTNGALKVNDFSVKQGDAELSGDLEWEQHGISLKAKGKNVDLQEIARALGLDAGRVRGKVTVDADIVSRKDFEQGTMDVKFEGLELDGQGPMTGQAYAELDDGRLIAQSQLEVTGLGSMGAALDLTLGGRLNELDAYRRATGSSRIELYAVNLGYFSRYLPENSPVKKLGGIGTARIRVERKDPEHAPSMLVDAGTRGLQLEVPALNPELVTGIDLQLGGAFDGTSGRTSGSVRAVDANGPLVSASGAVSLNADQLWEDPAAFLKSLDQTKIETVFVLPAREFQQLPVQLRPPAVDGVLSGRLALNGRANAPVLSGQLAVDKLRGTSTRLASPISLRSRFSYASDTGKFGGTLEATRRSGRIIWGNFSGTAPFQKLSSEGMEAVVGGGSFSVENLPLELFQPLERAKLEGNLRGMVALSKRGRTPDFNARLELSEGRVQGIQLGQGELSVRAVGEQVSAQADFKDRNGDLSASLNTQLDWSREGAAFGERPVVVDFESSSYDAVLLLPFIDELLSELNGRLDAKVHAELRKKPEAQAVAEQRSARAAEAGSPEPPNWDATFSGYARLRGGVLRPKALGLQLRNANLDLVAKREGAFNTVEVNDLSASARSDKHNFKGRAKIYFDGIHLSHGWATAGLDEVPFVVGGVRLADLTGQVGASLRQDPDRITSRVEIPSMRILLPRSTGRSLIELTENPNIDVVQPLGPPTERDEAALPWFVTVDLGDDVRVQSSTINIRLYGNPELRLDNELQVDGKLVLPAGGRAIVAGKLFVVENGFIQFDTDDFRIRISTFARSGVRLAVFA